MQHPVLPPEKRHAQNHEQSTQDEVGNSEDYQEAASFAGQARTLEIMFTTGVQEAQRKSYLHLIS